MWTHDTLLSKGKSQLGMSELTSTCHIENLEKGKRVMG